MLTLLKLPETGTSSSPPLRSVFSRCPIHHSLCLHSYVSAGNNSIATSSATCSLGSHVSYLKSKRKSRCVCVNCFFITWHSQVSCVSEGAASLSHPPLFTPSYQSDPVALFLRPFINHSNHQLWIIAYKTNNSEFNNCRFEYQHCHSLTACLWTT